jgi:hypothetical protein
LPPPAAREPEAERGEQVPWRVEFPGAPALEGLHAYPPRPPELRVVRASSHQPGEGEPEHAVDGDPETYWHTRWTPDAPAHPHEIVLDLGAVRTLVGVRYKGREGMPNGRVDRYEVRVLRSLDAKGPPAAAGRLENHDRWQEIRFGASVAGRYLVFTALSEVNGNPWTSAAELEPLGE